jgi:hypothetical protein
MHPLLNLHLNPNRFTYLLSAVSYLLTRGLACAWDDDDGEVSHPLASSWEREIDAKKKREIREMRDFLGAVYRGEGAMNITHGNLAQGAEGSIVRTGSTFSTPRGVYVKVGDNWFLPDGEGSVRKVGSSFLGPDGAVVSTGSTYLGAGGNSVVAGQSVFRNFPSKPYWSSR